MRVRCPICGRSQRVTDAEVGLPTLCPACGNRFTVAATDESAAVDPAASTIPAAPPDLPVVAAAATSESSALATLLWLVAVVIAFAGGVGIGWVLHAMSSSSPVVAGRPLPTTPLVVPPPRSTPSATEATPATTTAPSNASLLGHAVTRPASQPAREAAITPVATPVVVAPPPPKAVPMIHPVVPASANAPDLDQRIGRAIDRGTTYLLGRMKNGSLTGYGDMGKVTYSGLDALACYAVLQAGQATHDPRLGEHSPDVEAMLNALRELPLDKQKSSFPPSPGSPFTYAHSLRAAALSVFNRHEDRYTLRMDTDWLLRAAHKGAYTYDNLPNLRGSIGDEVWDNSNSQYGALGVWSALQSDIEVPNSYWSQVEKHWLSCQLPNGQWGYSPGGGDAELSMTVAGITMLFVTQDQLSLYEQATTLGRPPFIPALARGLDWLEAGDNSVSLPFTNRTYNLYGLERAALASGFKYFGTHNWYRELAIGAMRRQLNDGSWQEEDPIVDTAFTLLFLSRGRHPILMNKLRFLGSWSNRPRDVANLAAYASKELERPLNWQVVSLASDWTDWTDSPVLYVASHEPFPLSVADLDKLRKYAENGGLIYLQTDGESQQFDTFATALAKRLFPEYAPQKLPPTHPLFSTLYPLKKPPDVEAVSNGSRLLMVHCLSDVDRVWQLRNWSTSPESFQFGVNVFIYAAGKSDFLNKLTAAYVPPPDVRQILSIPVARLRYAGEYDPEPFALQRWGRLFLAHTSFQADIRTIDLQAITPATSPVALLTGTAAVTWSSRQAKAVQDYVADGGILIVDAAGGSTAFAQSVRDGLLSPAFPKAEFTSLKSDDPLMTSTYDGMKSVRLRLRPYLAEKLGTPTEPLQKLAVGRGRVLFSDYDLTTALLGATTYSIDGYTPSSATALLDNIVLWAAQRPPAAE